MKHEHLQPDDDAEIGALLREVGPGEQLSSAATEEVRRAVRAEWLVAVTQRRRRRRVATIGIAASFALVVFVAAWVLRFNASAVELPVSIAYVQGVAQLQLASQTVRTVKVSEDVPIGSVLITDAATRIALGYGTDVSVRIDEGTRIERVSGDRFRLIEGALYVDADPNASGHDLIVETAAGDVRHLGTQYQVRQLKEIVEVSIREGRVEIALPNGAALASAGERVKIDAAGELERQAISAQDPQWNWAEGVTPPFAIDDRTLAEFLDWVARETGREVIYASTDAQTIARSLKLRGSIEGLDPETALSAVLSTTEFVRYDTRDNLIGVQLAR